MTTNKPRVVAWYTPTTGDTLPVVALNDHSQRGEPLIRLSDYEALQAEFEKLESELSTVKKVAYGNVDLLDECEDLRYELEMYKSAFNRWLEKSEWVQETATAKELGMHRADVMKSRIEASQAENDKLRSELDAHKAARIAYASEFPPDGDGQPDVGSIHQDIRKLKEAKSEARGGYQPAFSNYDAKPK